jgi:hypothetical protein
VEKSFNKSPAKKNPTLTQIYSIIIIIIVIIIISSHHHAKKERVIWGGYPSFGYPSFIIV